MSSSYAYAEDGPRLPFPTATTTSTHPGHGPAPARHPYPYPHDSSSYDAPANYYQQPQQGGHYTTSPTSPVQRPHGSPTPSQSSVGQSQEGFYAPTPQYAQQQPMSRSPSSLTGHLPGGSGASMYSYNPYAQGTGSSRGGEPALPAPPPLLDHSHLRPGKSALLLSHDRTLELYRANAKKTHDPELQFEFAVFMIDAAKSLPAASFVPGVDASNPAVQEKAEARQGELLREALGLLKRLADRGHSPSQYFLADCYANGLGTARGKQDFDRAYPLFVLAAKHGHPDAAYRAGTCCENGWGCRKENGKAVQFYRKAAAALHPGAMYRLGLAELNGELGLSKRPKEGVKWLKRSAEHATHEFPHALHELALLHERGVDNVVFVDFEYAAELLANAAELGYAPSAYRLGECYEYGKMGCPQDAALSIHYYNIAAQQNHRDACFALTAWYLVGSPGVLPQSDTEAYLWARRAAEQDLAKAQYAVGYFLEVGIGVQQDVHEAIQWYKKAAQQQDKRAIQRLRSNSAAAGPISPQDAILTDRREEGGEEKDGGCVVM